MPFVTIPDKKIVFVSVILFWSTTLYAQLKVELNFGENDNYLIFKRIIGTRTHTISETNLSKISGFYRIVYPTKPSPSGGKCLVLSGSEEPLIFPKNTDIHVSGNRAFSVSMWFWFDASTPSGNIVYSDNGFISGYRLYLEARQLILELRHEKKEMFILDSVLTPNEWIHIGFICDGAGDSVVFYLNGNPKQTYKFRILSQIQTGSNSGIGATLHDGKISPLKAQIDRFRFFAGLDTVFESVKKDLLANKSASKRKTVRPAELPVQLHQNYPNPFNNATRISFTLQKNGSLSLKIYDLLGNRIQTLVEEDLNAGTYEYYWNGCDARESPVPSGIYLIRLEMDDWVLTRKMVLVK